MFVNRETEFGFILLTEVLIVWLGIGWTISPVIYLAMAGFPHAVFYFPPKAAACHFPTLPTRSEAQIPERCFLGQEQGTHPLRP